MDTSHKVGPTMLHFRQHTLTDVHTRREKCWEKLIEEQIPIPTNSINIYKEGILEGRLIYGNDLPVYEPHNLTKTSEQSDCSVVNTTQSNKPTIVNQTQIQTPSPSSCAECQANMVPEPNIISSTTGNTSQTQATWAMDPKATHHQSDISTDLMDLNGIIHPSLSESSPAHIPVSKAPQPSSPSIEANPSSSSLSVPNLKSSHIVIEVELPPTQGLKTSLGASMVKVIGHDSTIQEFDELCSKLKELKRSKTQKKREAVKRYKHLSSLLSARVLAKRTQLDGQIRDLEHQHFITHGKVPDHDNDAYTQYQQETV